MPGNIFPAGAELSRVSQYRDGVNELAEPPRGAFDA